MGNVLGNLVETVLVRGLFAFEQLFPMPARLGAPLPLGGARRANADPVVLVGGFANTVSGWNEWRRSLEADGFEVYVFDPPTAGLGDMDQAARDVAAFIAQVRRKTGRAVDVIGFSEGGLLARMAVARFGALGSVDRITTLATPHGGVAARPVFDALGAVRALHEATPTAALQLLEGSDLLRAVEASDRQLRRVGGAGADGAPRYASIMSMTHDLFVSPWSAWLPGALNVPVRRDRGGEGGPNHFEMLHTSSRAYEAARLLLLDASPQAAVAAGLLER